MRKIILVAFIAVVTMFLTSCLPADLGKHIEIDKDFQLIYMVGSELPDFGDVYINSGNFKTEHIVDTGNLSMNRPGYYLVTVTIYEKDNVGNKITIELQVLVNDQTLHIGGRKLWSIMLNATM